MQPLEGWVEGKPHLGNNEEVFDTELYAFYQVVKTLKGRKEKEMGQHHTIFTN